MRRGLTVFMLSTLPICSLVRAGISPRLSNSLPEDSSSIFVSPLPDGEIEHLSDQTIQQAGDYSLRRKIYRYFRQRPNPLIMPDGGHRKSNKDPKRLDHVDYVAEYLVQSQQPGHNALRVGIFHGGAATADKTDPSEVGKNAIEVENVAAKLLEGLESGEVTLALEKPLKYMENSNMFNCGFLGGAVRIPFLFSRVSNPLTRLLEDIKATLMTRRFIGGRPIWNWEPVWSEVQVSKTTFNPRSKKEGMSKEVERVSLYGVPRLKNPISSAIFLLNHNPTDRKAQLNNKAEIGFRGQDALQVIKLMGGRDQILTKGASWSGVTAKRWASMMKVFHLDKADARGETANGEVERSKNTTGAAVFMLNKVEGGWEASIGSATTTDGLNGAPIGRIGDSSSINGGTAKVVFVHGVPYAVAFSTTGTGANIVRGSVADVLGELRSGVNPVQALMNKLVEQEVDDLGIVMLVSNLVTGEVRAYSASNTPPPYDGFRMGVGVQFQDESGKLYVLEDRRQHVE